MRLICGWRLVLILAVGMCFDVCNDVSVITVLLRVLTCVFDVCADMWRDVCFDMRVCYM